jgi:hypothetical protein
MTPIFRLFAPATLALAIAGCGAPPFSRADSAAGRIESAETRVSAPADREGYYAVIESITVAGSTEYSPRPASGANGDGEHSPAYAIRVRFDDRSRRTVTQVGLDGLRIGDGVRIERDRVRRY